MRQPLISAFYYAATLIMLASCGQRASSQTASTGSAETEEPNDPSKPVNLNVRADNKYFSQEKDNDFYLYLTAKTGKAPEQKDRTPLNIAIVIDRSGSMSGEKIEYAKKAAKFVIDQLSSEDFLSIVNYDDVVEITSSSQQVKNKELLKAAVDKLYDRGSTNLTGGMMEGYKQVKKTKKSNYVNRVLLLTDGLANVGITEPNQIKKLVLKKYQEEGIALSTFGVGADYNEDLLTMLAETGRANYYFIASADKIPDIFAKELRGLLSVTAQNAVAEVTIPENMQCEKVYGYPYEIRNNKVIVQFNDLYSEEEKAILIKFKARRNISSKISFDCRLSYTDAISYDNISLHKTVAMLPSSDKELVRKNQNEKVLEMIALFTATEAFDEALKYVDEGNYEKAKERAEDASVRLKASPRYSESAKLQQQEIQISVYAKDIEKVRSMKDEERKTYQKSNKAYNYGTKKGK